MTNLLDKNDLEKNIVIYQTQDGTTKIEVTVENDYLHKPCRKSITITKHNPRLDS